MSINVSRTVKYFNEADVRQLLSSITVLEDKALIGFGIDTGLRMSEVVEVITSNINFEENAVLAYDYKKDEWRNAVFTQPVGNLLQMYLNERNTKDQRLFPFSWKTAERKVKRNYPGLVTLYVAPRDLAHEIPEHSRGRFITWSRSSLHKKEQIIRKIQTKGKSNQLQEKGPGLLVIYDRFLPAEEAVQFFEDPADDVGAVLATYPVLSALILIAPPLLLESVTERVMSKEHRVYIEHSLPDREGERIIVWKNKHADFPFPEILVNVLENYPRDLSRLFGSSNTGDPKDREEGL